MSKAKSSRPERPTVAVGRVSKTGQFVSIREAKSRPATVVVERLFIRDSKTGSFTTKKSTATIRSSADKFSDALESLAKK